MHARLLPSDTSGVWDAFMSQQHAMAHQKPAQLQGQQLGCVSRPPPPLLCTGDYPASMRSALGTWLPVFKPDQVC